MRLAKRSRPAWHWLVSLIAVVVLALAAWINLPQIGLLFDSSANRIVSLPAAPAFTRGQRILILSPHPDDETLCCGGLIAGAALAGAQVDVVWATAGDGFEFAASLSNRTLDPGDSQMRALGQTRAQEALRAAAALGIPASRTVMLGYPDGGLSALFTTHYTEAYTAPTTGAFAVYVRGAQTPGAPFTGQTLEADLGRVLDRVKPDLVLAPAPQDFHPDHRTLSYIAQRLMAARGQADALRFWVVHGGLEWPVPKGLHPELPLTLPPLAASLPWQRVDLTAAGLDRKRQAIAAYVTQTRIMNRFMQAFVRRNELLSAEALPEPGVPAPDVQNP
ncbi:LmbE-related protein [Deinococcus saxicola]|uniref:PIG-L deacetylase family protein n=1 Tax=Deinococcus saxicola TaxID=249406 RepID=UPI0039EE54A7